MRFTGFQHLRLIPCGWLSLAALMLPNAAYSQAAAQLGAEPSLHISDGGMVRVLHLALDEISVKHGGKRVPEKVSAANVADLLIKVQAARERERSVPAPGEIELVAYEEDAKRSEQTRRVITRKLLIQYAPGTAANEVAASLGLTLEASPDYAPGMAILAAATSEAALDALPRLRALPQVTYANPMLARWLSKKSIPNDPLLSQQWHLRNTSQSGGALGIDANVTPVWDNYRGAGVTLCIIDDGLQHTHPDLAPNYKASLAYDFNDGDADPAPDLVYNDSHGTACAGVAAARGNNGIGGCGVANEATLTGFRLIAGPSSDQDEADAFLFHNDVIQVKSNSWGPYDDGGSVYGPDPLAKAALKDGATNGRGGLGTIYVFAGGNGNAFNDNSNYDGYANSIYTIGVGAINDFGFQTYYSEPGANLHVCAPSNGRKRNKGIVTCDLMGEYGYNSSSRGTADLSDRNYTKTFGGTSSACPLVAGVCALMLQANPTLGWRDVQEILLRSARPVHHADSDWTTNGAGFHFNHKYGAGMVDTQAAVTLAKDWVKLGTLVELPAIFMTAGLDPVIPDNNSTGITRKFTVTTPNLRVEQVTMTVNITHQNRGDLEIFLTSPSGTVSRLAEQHPDPGHDFAYWTFSSVRHWGETAAGTWTLTIRDRVALTSGVLTQAYLNIYGSTVATARVVPGVATLTAETNLPLNLAADPGERVSYNIGLKNIGAANSGNLTATLVNVGGVTGASAAQNYGVLPTGGTAVTRAFSFTAGGASGTSSKLVLRLEVGGIFIGYVTTQIPLGAKTVTTPTGPSVNLTKTATSTYPASPYPANLAVSGITGRVHNVRAKLNGLTYGSKQNMEVYLGGPDNLNVALFTEATTAGVSSKNFSFEDNAPVFFPRAGGTVDGNYRSWDFDYWWYMSYDGFPSEPATDEHGYTLGEFNGLNANGNWRLYVENSSATGTGALTSWNVELTSVSCTDNTCLTNQDISVDEGAGSATVSVTRTGGGEGTATVQYATAAVSATAGVDYTDVAGTLTFAPGETTKEFSIPITNDSINESAETIKVTLSAPTGNTTLDSSTTGTGTVTIVNREVHLTPIEIWRQTHFGLPDNSGDGEDLKDYDKDGIVNLLEYAFGLPPTQNSNGQLPQGRQLGGSFVVEFTQPADVSGIIYGAEWSTTLRPGSWTPVPDSPNGNGHSFSVPNSTRPGLFMRLRVTRP